MSDIFEIYVAYIVDHTADGKWSHSVWSNPIGYYSSKEAIYKNIQLKENQHLFIQTQIFQSKYGSIIYMTQPHMETLSVPHILTNNKNDIQQTYYLSVSWKQFEYDHDIGKYILPDEKDDLYYE